VTNTHPFKAEQPAMSKLTVFVGLDYHKDTIQVCVMDPAGTILANRTGPNEAAAVAGFVARHGGPVQAAIEASTGSAHLADELANRFGWSISQAHPGYVHRLKQSPDKTDWQDARLLADLVRVGYLPKVWLAPEPVRQLRLVVRYRQQLVERRRALKLRVGAVLRQYRVRSPFKRAWTRAWRAWVVGLGELGEQGRWVVQQHVAELAGLEAQVRVVEDRLRSLTATDPLVQRLLRERGVGLITACVLRAEIGRGDRFRTGKQLARYCGVTPRNASSGSRQADAGLIAAGNPLLRTTLIETAHRLRRLDPRWGALSATMERSGKPTCVIIAAIANRWVRWLYHQLCAPELNSAA
jgi:transposase